MTTKGVFLGAFLFLPLGSSKTANCGRVHNHLMENPECIVHYVKLCFRMYTNSTSTVFTRLQSLEGGRGCVNHSSRNQSGQF